MPRTPKLDTFTRSYIGTALWSSMDESDESGGDPLDKNYSINDLAPETLERVIQDVEQFRRENAEALEVIDDEGAGHDFWLTRNGHGAGFWDGDWPEPQATLLTKASKRMGHVDLYVGDDGQLYMTPDRREAEGHARRLDKDAFEGVTTGKFSVGERVQLHPGTDRWMMGDRYGEVVKVTREYVHVKLDKSGKTMKFSEGNLLNLDGSLRGMSESGVGGANFQVPTTFNVTDAHGGFTAVMRSGDTLWRPGRATGHTGRLVEGSVNRSDFYQQHRDVVSALYRIPAYQHPVKVWWTRDGRRLA